MFPKLLTWNYLRDYVEKNNGIKPLVLPIGSVEGHGLHLPITTDTIIAEYIADKLAERNNWISLPLITYSIARPVRIGNVNISKDVFTEYIKDILRHFIEFGQKFFIIILGHGGPEIKESLRSMVRNLTAYSNITVYIFHILKVLETLGLVDQRIDRHAGEWETSLMLFINPSLVGDQKVAERAIPSKYGVYGDPTKATAEKGAKFVNQIIQHVEQVVNELVEKKINQFYNWE